MEMAVEEIYRHTVVEVRTMEEVEICTCIEEMAMVIGGEEIYKCKVVVNYKHKADVAMEMEVEATYSSMVVEEREVVETYSNIVVEGKETGGGGEL